MDVVNSKQGHFGRSDSLIPSSSIDSDDFSSTESDSNDSTEFSNEVQKDNIDLSEDLKKHVLECYKSESNVACNSSSDISNDDEASALCQFMDILNDLDEVLDKSLLACLDDDVKLLESDDDDVVCKVDEAVQNQCVSYIERAGPSCMNDTQNILNSNTQPSAPPIEDFDSDTEKWSIPNIVRSKSLSDIRSNDCNTFQSLERAGIIDNDVRGSMRRLDPILLPAVSAQEPLTLPVILFLEHHVNMRPTSAPIQLQVTTANLSGDVASGPLIVGRRALLMNRALAIPSPEDSDVTGEWMGRNTARSDTGSRSTSSTSTESLNGVLPPSQTIPSAAEERSEETEEPPFGVWPHNLSAMLACLSCTVGVFNISRFAIFSVHFGASFIVQFFILSLFIGIPMFTLYLCLGQILEAGPIDMWRISPIFKGVGVALLIVQTVIGMYSIIGLSWIFVFFRDSFVNAGDRYKWAFPHDINSDDVSQNVTYKIQETLPQYFHGEVLQRNLGSNNTHYGTIKFQVAFNLAVVWMIVFVSLSKGLRSYGKAVYMLIFLPICGTLILCTKLLTLIPYDTVTNVFSDNDWSEFFINTNSWVAALQESFLTWGLLGSCVMQLTSHKSIKSRTRAMLRKETACIVAFTFAVLLLASFLANTCVQILKNYGLYYVPSSFEDAKVGQFLWAGAPAQMKTRYQPQYGSLVGVTVFRGGAPSWHPLHLATQIVPATLAVLPADLLSPAWAVIFYFILIMFGIAQQLAIWHCVIAGIMAFNVEALKIWETSITFFSCVFGLIMGLFLTTDSGIRIVHFVDYVWVGSWVHCLVHVSLCCGVFVVRGRPYSGEAVARALLRGSSPLAAAPTLAWSLALPVLLATMCVIDFRSGQQRVLYNWRKATGYWPIWTRQIAVLMQQGVLLTVPVTAFIQTWRYMSKGPPDILDRFQNLYRPRMVAESEWSGRDPTLPQSEELPARTGTRARAPSPDPPPKYTPPPSYSTATGARLINTIRRSFRTFTRMRATRTNSTNNDTSQIPITLSETVDNRLTIETQPPEYSGMFPATSLTHTDETDTSRRQPDRLPSLPFRRDYLRRSYVTKSDSAKNIRSSLRRSFKFGALTTSHEHLMRDAEPISTTVAMSAMLAAPSSPHAQSRASVI